MHSGLSTVRCAETLLYSAGQLSLIQNVASVHPRLLCILRSTGRAWCCRVSLAEGLLIVRGSDSRLLPRGTKSMSLTFSNSISASTRAGVGVGGWWWHATVWRLLTVEGGKLQQTDRHGERCWHARGSGMMAAQRTKREEARRGWDEGRRNSSHTTYSLMVSKI